MPKLDVGAQKFWALRLDPFFMRPLRVSRAKERALLVKSVPIKRMNDLVKSFKEDDFSKIVLLEGSRGSGKTTALKYVCEQIGSNPEVFIVFCNVSGLDVESPEELGAVVHKWILLSLCREIRRSAKLRRVIDLSNVSNTKEKVSLEELNFRIQNLIENISYWYSKIFICLDNIDKVRLEKWRLICEYFAQQQPFYESVTVHSLSKDAICYVVISSMIFMERILTKDSSYLGDNTIRIEKWDFDGISQLVEKRLEFACRKKDFDLNMFFTRDALQMIYASNDGNPRYVMSSCKALMQQASIDKVKPISKGFCSEHQDLLRGTSFFVVGDLELVRAIIRTEYAGQYLKLRSILRSGKHDPLLLVDKLILIYMNQSGKKKELEMPETQEDREILAYLTKTGLLPMETSSRRDVYNLYSPMLKMFDALYRRLQGDLDIMRLFFITSAM